MSASALTVSNGTQQSAAVATIFSNGEIRKNADGRSMGTRLSFIQDMPAGNIRAHLKSSGLKGKALTAAVDRVLRGDNSMGWAMLHATLGEAQKRGFQPVVADLNKSGTRFTAKLERPTVVFGTTEVKALAKETLTGVDLLGMAQGKLTEAQLLEFCESVLAARKEQPAADQPAIEA
jgi:hypothetical protein